MTETVFDDENTIVTSSKAKLPFEEEIATRKTIVYETLVDPSVIKIAAENLKNQLFSKYGILKATIDEVRVVSIEKYYEPFIRITGKYAIDYYRKRTWAFNVENNVSEVTFPFARIEAKTTNKGLGKTQKIITLEGEERVKTTAEADLTLSESGKDIPLKNLPTAASEKNPEEALAKTGAKQVPSSLDLSLLRTRIFNRPADVNWIANETFQVTERLAIYVPRFRAVFKHAKTGKERTVEFDGLTGKLIHTCDSRTTQTSI